MTGKRGSRCKQLLYDLKEKRGYWKLEEEARRLHSMESSLLKKLWTSRKTDYGLNASSLCKIHKGTPESLVPVYQTTQKYIKQQCSEFVMP